MNPALYDRNNSKTSSMKQSYGALPGQIDFEDNRA